MPKAARPAKHIDARTADIRSNLDDRERGADRASQRVARREHHRLLWRFSDVLMTNGIPTIAA